MNSVVSGPGPVAGDARGTSAGPAPDGGVHLAPKVGAARAALARLGARARQGDVGLLGGVHAYDPDVAATYRAAAVLVLLSPPADDGAGDGPATGAGPDLFLVQRSPHLRHHPGQIALPGGRAEPGDGDLANTALREAHEEIGLLPDHVEVLGELPPVLVPISRYVVTPVLGWTTRADLATRVDPGEVLHTIRVGVGRLLDPSARAAVTVRGHRSAGFRVPSGWVWGFTGNLLDHLFTELGWTRPWDTSREVAMAYDAVQGLIVPE
ncbi:NUDIX hydrolase [Georgenia sp. AZ-5]|uniref:NUDIX hydrolase n=1 Tax=Georgenia sp. AZ-5 TaxID=3367526 RepID=UPI003754F314